MTELRGRLHVYKIKTSQVIFPESTFEPVHPIMVTRACDGVVGGRGGGGAGVEVGIGIEGRGKQTVLKAWHWSPVSLIFPASRCVGSGFTMYLSSNSTGKIGRIGRHRTEKPNVEVTVGLGPMPPDASDFPGGIPALGWI